MLTVQPKFTNQSSYKTSFKGDSDFINESKYNEKKSYYENQKSEFDKIINDEYVPEGMKKGAKVFKIASEGILEGWAVTWAATKGGKFLKSGYLKAANSKFVKWATEMLKPLGKGLKKSSKNIKTSLLNGLEKIKTSKPVTKTTSFLNKAEETLNKTKLGQVVVATIKGIGKALKTVGKAISSIAHKIAEPFKKVTYDKAAKATASTLGVGSGIAGAYSAARKETKATDADLNKDYAGEVEDFNEDLAKDCI